MRRPTHDRLNHFWPPMLSLLLLLVAGATAGRAATPRDWSYTDASGARVAFDDCDNVTDGGTISGSIRGCANPLYQAPQLTNVTLPTGGSGVLEFLWMKTTTNPGGALPVSWDIIPGSTAMDYTPAPVTQTTYYMRCSRRAGCDKWAGETNYVTVLVDCCENVTDGGRIGGDQRNCGAPFDPEVLTNVAPATGGTNRLVYTWYQSTTSTVFQPGSLEWVVAGAATTPYFDPGAISTTTHYVRAAQREFCPTIGAWSNVVTVVANPLPSVKSNVTDVSCFGESDGAIAVTVLAAVNPVSITWADVASTATTRSNLAAGTYTVTVTDGLGCSHDETITVATPATLAATIDATVDNCNFDNDASLSAAVTGGSEPYVYRWSNGLTDQVINGLGAGTYTLVVTDRNGCTATAETTVAPPSKLSASATATQPTCGQSNGQISVTASGGTTPFRYAWTPAVSTAALATDLPGGSYGVTVTDANGCEVRLSVDLDVVAPLTVALEGDEVSCSGVNDAEVRSTVTGGTAPYTYLWNTGATTPRLTNLGPGRYVVTVRDALACETTQEITLVEPNALTATIDVTQPICFEDGGTLTANITGGQPPYAFDWGAAGQNNVQTLNNLAAGTYTLNVTDAGGCSFTTSAAIEATTLLTLDTLATPASCPNSDDGTAEVRINGGTAPYSIRWSDALAQTTPTATQLIAGVYTASVEDARGCVKTLSVEVRTLSSGPVTEEEIDQITCAGAADGAIRLTTTGGIAPYTYAWEDAPTGGATRTGLGPDTYEVTVTDAAGCFTEESYTIVEPELLTAKALPTTFFPRYFHVSAFDVEDGGLAAQAEGGTAPYAYAWSTGATSPAIAGLGGGDYTLTVTDANGCSAAHDTTLVEPSQLSDFVWEDTDGDGIQDADEVGIPGIQIRLSGSDFNGVGVDFSTSSDANGRYKFDRLPIGNYVVRFRLQGFQDYLFSPANQGADDTRDSDMDPVLLLARATVLAHGVGDYDLDAGFIPRTSVITISDKVWYDEDHDGIHDPFEAPVQGVTLELVRAADDIVVNTQVSDESGKYAFADVTPNKYYVRFNQSSSSVGFGFVAAPQMQGTNRAADSDFDPVTKRSAQIVVTPSTPDITDLDLGLQEDCATVADGGQITGNEQVCVGQTAGPITSGRPASGTVRYKWLRSTSSATYRGPNDPAWAVISGATGASYQPSSLSVTSYYIRLAKDETCGADFTGVTNIITKAAIANPRVTFASVTGSRGATYVNRQITLGLTEVMTVTADSTAPLVFAWDFGADASPRTASGRVVSGVTYANTNDSRYVYLAITNSQGCVGRDSFLVNTLPFLVPGEVGTTNAAQAPGGNAVTWSAITLPAGAHFEVQRAGQDGAYRTVGTVAARAIGEWTAYEFLDKGAPSGKTVYRVVQHAPNGKASYGQPAFVGAEASLTVMAYPNPARDRVTVDVMVGAERAAAGYTLTNVFGATVLRGRLGEAGALDVSGLSAGTYYLTVVSDGGERVVRPFVKY